MSRPGMSPAEYVEEVEFLTSLGVSSNEILTRLGTTTTAITKGLRRAGRPDLARPFDRLRGLERAAGRVCACGAPVKSHRRSQCFACGHKQRVRTRRANEERAA